MSGGRMSGGRLSGGLKSYDLCPIVLIWAGGMCRRTLSVNPRSV